MRSGIIFLFIVCLSLSGFSQSLEKINSLMEKADYKGAKILIDKIMSDPAKAKEPENLYFKGRIYNSLSADKSLSAKERYDLKVEAYEAFLQNQQLDPKDIRMKLEAYLSYLDLYGGFYDLGVQFFNDKMYEESFNSFSKSYDVENYIQKKGYTYEQTKLPIVDTALLMNMGLAASLAKKDVEAANYYRKISDANIYGKQYEAVYETLAAYYEKTGDTAALNTILAKATKYYPSNNYLNDFALRQLEKSGGKQALYTKYDEMLKNDPSNFPLAYNYAIDMYNAVYVNDEKIANAEAVKNRLTEVLKIAIQNDKGIDATVLMANHLYNAASDAFSKADDVRGTKPADIKEKKDLKDKANKLMDESIPYALAALKYFDSQESLKTSQKATRVNILSNLVDIYNAKGDAKKAAEYDKLKTKGL